MKIEVLYIGDCCTHHSVVVMAQEVVKELDVDAGIEEIQVRSPAEAERLQFLGSPSLRVDRVDVEPSAGSRSDYGLG